MIRLRFKELFLVNACIILLVGFLSVGQSQATVVQPGVCTNFTCRWGQCEQFVSGTTCHCFTGVKGPNCNLLLVPPTDDLCTSNPCWGGGNCTITGNTWACNCPYGRYGKDCRSIDPNQASICEPNPCQNGGVCTLSISLYNQPICACIGDWTGPYCSTPINICTRSVNPCFNGGSCNTAANSCECPRNFTGRFCETYVQLIRENLIKVKNLGWYVAGLELRYQTQDSLTGQKIYREEKASIAALESHSFRIPETASYNSPEGINLVAFAYLGKEILNVRVPYTEFFCIEVWGTTLVTAWSQMPC